MRRLLASILAFLMVFSLVSASATSDVIDTNSPEYKKAQEIATHVSEMLHPNSDIENMFLEKFIIQDEKIFAYESYSGKVAQFVDKELKIVMEPDIEDDWENRAILLLQDSEKAYCLKTATGVLYELDTTTSPLTLKEYKTLPWNDMVMDEGDYKNTRNIQDGFIKDGKVYLTVQNDNWMNEVRIFDTATGNVKIVSQEDQDIRSIVPFKESFVFAKYNNIVYYDEKTNAFENLLDVQDHFSGISSVAVSEGQIYFKKSNILYRVENKAPIEVAYLDAGMDGFGDEKFVIVNNHFYMMNGSKLVQLDLSKGLPKNSIKLNGYTFDFRKGISAFSEQNPDYPLVVDDSTYFPDTQKLVDHMKSANAADIYLVQLSNVDLKLLQKKDYIAPLDISLVDHMVENYKKPLVIDGQLYAFPVAASARSYGVSPAAIKKIGLTEDDIPKTYIDLLEFIDEWQSSYQQEFPEMKLFEGMEYTNLKENLATEVLFQNEIQQNAQGEDIDFTTKDILTFFERLEKTDFYGFYNPDDQSDTIGMGGVMMMGGFSDDVPSAIFENYHDAGITQWQNNTYISMPLAIGEGNDPCTGLSMSVLVVNPESKNLDKVHELLATLHQNMDASTRITLYDNANTPIENEYAAQFLDAYDDAMAYYQKAYDEADDQTKAILDQFKIIENYKELKDSYAKERYRVSEEHIKQYRENSVYIHPQTESLLDTRSEDIMKLFNRFRDGSMNARSLLKELQRKVEMMIMENE